MRILSIESLRFPGEGSSALGKSGPKVRPKGVADGQQVEIPVLHYDRTVGTHVGSMGAGMEAACKRRSRAGGKAPAQGKGVMRTGSK